VGLSEGRGVTLRRTEQLKREEITERKRVTASRREKHKADHPKRDAGRVRNRGGGKKKEERGRKNCYKEKNAEKKCDGGRVRTRKRAIVVGQKQAPEGGGGETRPNGRKNCRREVNERRREGVETHP